MVKTVLPLRDTRVRSLVRELRSHMAYRAVKTSKQNGPLNIYLYNSEGKKKAKIEK